MTQNRVFKLADIRKLNKQVGLGQISSMKMVETLNDMAYEWHTYKLQAYIDKQKENEKKTYTIEDMGKAFLEGVWRVGVEKDMPKGDKGWEYMKKIQKKWLKQLTKNK